MMLNYRYFTRNTEILGLISVAMITFSNCCLAEEKVEFERHIAPLLLKRCVECHNDNDASGGLNLTNQAGLLTGGDSGEVITPGKLNESYLWERVHDGEMPPEKQGKPQPLSEEERQVLKRWIETGATWPENRTLDLFENTTEERGGRDWWSFQPIVRPTLPAIKHSETAYNNIDNFVLARLEQANLTPAPLAENRQLLRRLHYDLVGLPPTIAEIDTFQQNPSLEAYEQHVDKLLASPHFGERWARYWLDLVRFAETCGYERDQLKPNAWRYRDYVIDSLNNDKPYNEFVQEQLAGDELPNRSEETVIATGFLRVGTWNDEPNDPHEYKYERLEDMVHTTSSAFLGLTIKCARCHDHKFDAIPQVDYYRMASSFWAGPIAPGSSKNLGGPTKEQLGYDVFGWTDSSPKPADFHLLIKGEPKQPGELVEPAHLSFLPHLQGSFTPPTAGAKTSQRRLQLAKWITDETNPLTARVFVNRIWQHHFGEALVRSPNNFGFTGEKPTHPNLLDWLASELIQGDWKAKRLHKMMVMSRTYRQSSTHPQYEKYAKQDFVNSLWWRANRRRLDAEAFRDSIVTAAGSLDLTQVGGESFKPDIPSEALEGLSKKDAAWTSSPPAEQHRRGLYIYSKRSLIDPFLTTFDFSNTTLPCAKRDVTVVAPQALALLNNKFVHKKSKAFAARIRQAAPEDHDAQINLAWRTALGRLPSPSEFNAAKQHLTQQQELFTNSTKNTHPQTTMLPQFDDVALHLRADRGIELDEQGRLKRWYDSSTGKHDAFQETPEARPQFVESATNDQPAIYFSGKGNFLHLNGQIIDQQNFSIFTVVSDEGTQSHRNVFSNWNGAAGNSTTSLFIGRAGAGRIRFSDDFSSNKEQDLNNNYFLLAAFNNPMAARIFLNNELQAQKSSPLKTRNLTTKYVIGQQGNINGEFWKGNIAEILIYNRALSDSEREQVQQYLIHRYQLKDSEQHDPQLQAFASLCHVLFNSNEFMYVD